MRELHIVSFDIPYPANYGGVIDVYYQIKALAKKGVLITLHCFQYAEKKEQPHLEELCREVYYYQRKIGPSGISISLPYIVYSRRNKQLLNRLSKAEGPILFQGLHCCYYLNHPRLRDKFKVVRCMNVEHEYYTLLAGHSRSPKKWYYIAEAHLLQNFQKVLRHAQVLLPISDQDRTYYLKNFTDVPQQLVTAFHGNEKGSFTETIGDYALFHGSLDVIENEKSVLFLVEKVFIDTDFPLMIAGKNPSEALIAVIQKRTNIKLVANPEETYVKELIAKAQINLMYSSQSSGLKLKLVNSLFIGRHIIANDPMLTVDGLHETVHRANKASQWLEKIEYLRHKPFTDSARNARLAVIENYSDDASVLKLMESLNLVE